MKKYIIAALFMFASTASNASEEITDRAFHALLTPSMIYAYTHSQYDKPTSTPSIVLVDVAAIHQVMECRKNCLDDITAIYDPNVKTVYVDKRAKMIPISNIMGLLIHEFVHFLQFEKMEYEETCEVRAFLESEAAGIQNGFLAGRGLQTAAKSMNFGCQGRSLNVNLGTGEVTETRPMTGFETMK